MNRYTFRKLDNTLSPAAGGDFIGHCNFMLENRMQCTRAGEYEVTDAESPDKPYQICKRHGAVLESQGKDWEAPVPEPVVEEPPQKEDIVKEASKPQTVADVLNKTN